MKELITSLQLANGAVNKADKALKEAYEHQAKVLRELAEKVKGRVVVHKDKDKTRTEHVLAAEVSIFGAVFYTDTGMHELSSITEVLS